jgi:hypothetical protein
LGLEHPPTKVGFEQQKVLEEEEGLEHNAARRTMGPFIAVPYRLCIPGLLLALTVSAPTQTFKGHQIGETPGQFIAAEPTLTTLVAGCKNDVPRLLTDDEVLRKYGKKEFAKIQRAEADAVAKASHIVGYYDQDPDAYGDKCAAILTIVATGSGTIDGQGYELANKYAEALRKRQTDALTDFRHIASYSSIPSPLNSYDPRMFTFDKGVLDHFFFLVYAITRRSRTISPSA